MKYGILYRYINFVLFSYVFLLRVGMRHAIFKIESDVSAVLVRNRRAKVVNQSFSVEMLGYAGHWGGLNHSF